MKNKYLEMIDIASEAYQRAFDEFTDAMLADDPSKDEKYENMMALARAFDKAVENWNNARTLKHLEGK